VEVGATGHGTQMWARFFSSGAVMVMGHSGKWESSTILEQYDKTTDIRPFLDDEGPWEFCIDVQYPWVRPNNPKMTSGPMRVLRLYVDGHQVEAKKTKGNTEPY
ncbi:unnamed protein product, partial [Amoebophrya sp. A25]